MSQTKISDLLFATDIAITDLLAIVQNLGSTPVTRKVSLYTLMSKSNGWYYLAASNSSGAAKMRATAIGTGTNDETIFNTAISTANSNGGGLVIIQSGAYSAQKILPMNNVHLYFEDGATIDNPNSNFTIFRHVDNTNGLSKFILEGGNFTGGSIWYSRGNVTDCEFKFNKFNGKDGVNGFIVFFDAFTSNPRNRIHHNIFSGVSGGWDMMGSGALDYSEICFNRFENGDAQGWGITSNNYGRVMGNVFYKVGNPIGFEGTTVGNLVIGNISFWSGSFKLSVNGGSDLSYYNIVEGNINLYGGGIEDGEGHFDTISGNHIIRSQQKGIFGAFDRCTISNNTIIESNWGNSGITVGGAGQTDGGIVLLNKASLPSPKNNIISDNRIYTARTSWTHPDGTVKSQSFTGGILIDSTYDNTDLEDNQLDNTYGTILDYGTNTHGENNLGVNPNKLFVQGNISGSITFTRVNGRSITATLTGSITPTITNGVIKGDRLRLKLTQGGSGSYTYTKTTTTKLAGGAITLSSAVGAVDIIDLEWDGSNWNETARSLNLS